MTSMLLGCCRLLRGMLPGLLSLVGLLNLVGLAACSAHPARFANQDPVRAINDDRPSPIPNPSLDIEPVYLSEVYVRQPLIQALTIRNVRHADDVNSWDEVPNSSWFRHRTQGSGAGSGYARVGPPQPPLTITRRDGQSIVVVDRRGERFRLQKDPLGFPKTSTAASAITSRLLWSLGYTTTEVHVSNIERSAFASESKAVNAFFPSDEPDASLRVAAKHQPKGIDLGPTEARGTRPGDINDTIGAEARRTLRALSVFAWWLQAPEMGRFSTRDYYMGEPGQGRTVHFITGLDHSLGVTRRADPLEKRDDPTRVSGNILTNFLTLGLKSPSTKPRGTADPLRDLSPRVNPSFSLKRPYFPAAHLRPEDAYWATKAMLRLPRDVLAWAVAAGALDDPELEAQLVTKLHSRRRDLAARVFANVTACELRGIQDDKLLITDLARAERLLTRDIENYRVTILDEYGKPFGGESRVLSETPEFSVKLPSGPTFEYLVVRIERRRAPEDVAPFELHVSRDGSVTRVLGIRH